MNVNLENVAVKLLWCITNVFHPEKNIRDQFFAEKQKCDFKTTKPIIKFLVPNKVV